MNHIQIQKEIEQEYFDEMETAECTPIEWIDEEDVYISKMERGMREIGMNSRRDFL